GAGRASAGGLRPHQGRPHRAGRRPVPDASRLRRQIRLKSRRKTRSRAMPKPSSNLSKLPPYLFAELDRKINEAKAKGVDIINLGIGDPDLPTPPAVVEALRKEALDPATHNYSPYSGTKEYRTAAAAWMKARFGVSVDPETEVLGLIGS